MAARPGRRGRRLTKPKRTALHLAAERNEADAIQLLAEHGADLDVQDTEGRTPQHRATYEDLQAAEALIELGADTEIEMKSGKKPLEIARKDCKHLKL